MKKILMSVAAVAAFALLSGCVSLEEFNRVQKHLETEQEANVAMSAELSRLEGTISSMRIEREKHLTAIEELRKKADATPGVTGEDLVGQLRKIWDNDMRGWETVSTGGAVGVRMDDSGVLFKSGSWDLTDGTKTKLAELATIVSNKLKKDPNIFVRVDGHTDSDPVKKLKGKGIQDNIHLSTMRAMAVRDFLVSKGVPKDRIFVAGFGEYWPIEGGTSAKSKQRNRRVEVYLGDPDALSIGALPGAHVQK